MKGETKIGIDLDEANVIALRDHWGTTFALFDGGIEILGRAGDAMILRVNWESAAALYWYNEESGYLLICGIMDQCVYGVDTRMVGPSLDVIVRLVRAKEGGLMKLDFLEAGKRVLLCYEYGVVCLLDKTVLWSRDDLRFDDMIVALTSEVIEYGNREGQRWSFSLIDGARTEISAANS